MATLTIANWSTSLSLSSIPPSVLTAAVRSFYNWYGCALGGSQHTTSMRAIKALTPFFGPATSSLLGQVQTQGIADPSHAALINGIASHVHDYDDTHLSTIIHPTGPVASAVLAMAEKMGNVSGEQILLALIVGVEVECKVGLAVWPAHYDVGW